MFILHEYEGEKIVGKLINWDHGESRTYAFVQLKDGTFRHLPLASCKALTDRDILSSLEDYV